MQGGSRIGCGTGVEPQLESTDNAAAAQPRSTVAPRRRPFTRSPRTRDPSRSSEPAEEEVGDVGLEHHQLDHGEGEERSERHA